MFAGALLKIYSTVRLVFIWGIKKNSYYKEERRNCVYFPLNNDGKLKRRDFICHKRSYVAITIGLIVSVLVLVYGQQFLQEMSQIHRMSLSFRVCISSFDYLTVCTHRCINPGGFLEPLFLLLQNANNKNQVNRKPIVGRIIKNLPLKTPRDHKASPTLPYTMRQNAL